MNDACYCDYEPAEMYVAERRRARKPHKCNECGRRITIGEQYEHVRAKWEGEMCSMDTCCRCLELRDFVVAHIPCSCWVHGNMIEVVMEDARAFAHETRGLMFGAYRRYVGIFGISK